MVAKLEIIRTELKTEDLRKDPFFRNPVFEVLEASIFCFFSVFTRNLTMQQTHANQCDNVHGLDDSMTMPGTTARTFRHALPAGCRPPAGC